MAVEAKNVGFSETGVTGSSCSRPTWVLGIDLAPLEEQYSLSITQLSLQPQAFLNTEKNDKTYLH